MRERCKKTSYLENVKTLLPLGIFFCKVRVLCVYTEYFVRIDDCRIIFICRQSKASGSIAPDLQLWRQSSVAVARSMPSAPPGCTYSLHSWRNGSLSVSPDPGSPQPQSSVSRPGASCPPSLPGIWHLSSKPSVVCMGTSESSSANLAANGFSALFPWLQISSCLPALVFFVFQRGQSGLGVILTQVCNRYTSKGHQVS